MVAKIIRENIYVDNVVLSVETVETAKEIYIKGKGAFASAGMNLREWLTNSQEVSNLFEQTDLASKGTTKVLGMIRDDFFA